MSATTALPYRIIPVQDLVEMEVKIGSRVRDLDGFRATVRYIGPVASAKIKTETWIGVSKNVKLIIIK